MYREVTMFEVKEALRLWLSGTPKKRIAAQVGLDPKTVRHYVAVGMGIGLQAGVALTEEHVRDVLLVLQPSGGRPRGDTWSQCVAQREAIERWLREGVRLSKIRKLLARTGVAIPYPTLHRFAVLELQFGRTASTIPVADGKAGEELQVDTGWVGWLTQPLLARTRRRFRAWIFTAVCSRYRFVYPTFEETTARAIEACEAAWEFFGGTFTVLIPDNTKAIIIDPDPLAPRITPAFLEYAQARHFHVDAARVRHPRDKGRVERAVPGVRDDCFAGEVLTTIDDARRHATHWCREEYGRRRHSRTQQRPREHFERDERPVLRAAPTTPYDIPLWSEPKVARDQLVQVLDSPLPWTRMRRVYALLGLARRYGAARVNDACAIALAAEMLDVHRLRRMLELGLAPAPAAPPARVITLARFLRPASQYALPLVGPERPSEGDPHDD